MDPLSIAASAVRAAEKAYHLYEFIQSARIVDETIRGLHSEVKQLGDVCRAVDRKIRPLASLPQGDNEDDELFEGIESQITGCVAAISKIESAISPDPQKKSNIFSRAVKLTLNQSDIDEGRRRIQSCTQSLQVSLTLVTLKVVQSTPEVIIVPLSHALTELRSLLNDQHLKLDSLLRRRAERALTEGTTLYTQSIAGGSVAGNQTDVQRGAIEDWIGSTGNLSLGGSHLSEIPVMSRNDTSNLTNTGDNIKMELSNAVLKAATKEMQDGHYKKALNYYKEYTDLVEDLPDHSKSRIDLSETHIAIATCAFHAQDAIYAEAALLTALATPAEHSIAKLSRCKLQILLAQTYVKFGSLKSALTTTEEALDVRRALLGTEHDECYEAIALLAHIHHLQEASIRAETYRSMIPVRRRPRFSNMFTDLWPEAEGSSRSYKSLNKGMVTSSIPGRFRRGLEIENLSDVAFSPDNSVLACTGYMPDCIVISSGFSKYRRILLDKHSAPSCIAFNRAGTKLASGHGGTMSHALTRFPISKTPLSICIWDVDEAKLVLKISDFSNQTNLCWRSLLFVPRTDQLFATTDLCWSRRGSSSDQMKPGYSVINATTGAKLHRFETPATVSATISQDSSQVAFVNSGQIQIYDPEDWTKVLDRIKTGKQNDKTRCLYTNDGSIIVSTSLSDLRIYDIDGRLLKTINATSSLDTKVKSWERYRIACAPNGLILLAVWPVSRKVYFCAPELGASASAGVETDIFNTYAGEFSPDSRYFAYNQSSTDCTVVDVWKELGLKDLLKTQPYDIS